METTGTILGRSKGKIWFVERFMCMYFFVVYYILRTHLMSILSCWFVLYACTSLCMHVQISHIIHYHSLL